MSECLETEEGREERREKESKLTMEARTSRAPESGPPKALCSPKRIDLRYPRKCRGRQLRFSEEQKQGREREARLTLHPTSPSSPTTTHPVQRKRTARERPSTRTTSSSCLPGRFPDRCAAFLDQVCFLRRTTRREFVERWFARTRIHRSRSGIAPLRLIKERERWR